LLNIVFAPIFFSWLKRFIVEETILNNNTET